MQRLRQALAHLGLAQAAGDTLILAPPLIVSEAQIGEIAEKTARAIRAVA